MPHKTVHNVKVFDKLYLELSVLLFVNDGILCKYVYKLFTENKTLFDILYHKRLLWAN